MDSDDNKIKQPAEAESKALIRERQKVKRLEETVDHKAREVERLKKEVERLKKRNEKLKQQLAAVRKTPKWAKANKPEDDNGKPGKKKGPKNGHKPNIRRRPEQADRDVVLAAEKCPCCDESLPAPSRWHEHWQTDIPKLAAPITTKFSVGWSWCKRCDRLVAPKERLKATKFGPNLHASVAYWKFGLGLTLGKIRTLLTAQYGLEISTGVLSGMLTRTSRWLEDAYEDIKTSLVDQEHLHADETGWRQDGRNFWLWSFANDYLSFYSIEKSRSQSVVRRILGETFDGVLITDFYGGYNAIECAKQKCWVHLLRELRELKDKHKGNKEIIVFARRLKIFFHRGVALALAKTGDQDVTKRLQRLRDDTYRFATLRYQHEDLQRLAKRLIKYRSELFTFIERGVDATNNNAEREIRPAVLMRKTSYGNRSSQGARNQEILMTGVRTSAKRGINFVETVSEHLACS
jgi:transposase